MLTFFKYFYHHHKEWFLKNQSAISSAEYMVLRDILGASLNSGTSGASYRSSRTVFARVTLTSLKHLSFAVAVIMPFYSKSFSPGLPT